jgi:hypothetical protein
VSQIVKTDGGQVGVDELWLKLIEVNMAAPQQPARGVPRRPPKVRAMMASACGVFRFAPQRILPAKYRLTRPLPVMDNPAPSFPISGVHFKEEEAMLRCLLISGLCLVAEGWAFAGEPPHSAEAPQSRQHVASESPGILQPGGDSKPTTTISGRKKLEGLLQAPANLDFGSLQTVTIKEVLDQLHKQHHLSIRFDLPTLSSVLNSDALASLPSSKQDTNDESKVSPASAPSSLDKLLNVQVAIQNVDLQRVSVATALRHAFDAAPTSADLDDELSGLPITLTNASLLDYVIEDDGLLITSRMNALTLKETRVYSVKNLQEFTPEQLAKVIRLSVRPWSWRSHLNDLGDQLKAGAPRLPSEMVAAVVKTGVQLVSDETGIAVDAAKSPEESSGGTKEVQTTGPEQFTIDSNALVNGLVTFAQASVSALEILHFADPPTGTIQTLPGKLIITQSQAAHREIADLLKQLADE